MTRGKRVVAIAAAITFVLTACGGDDESSETPPPTAAGDDGSVSTAPSTGGGEEPVKLAMLWEVRGESPVAVDDAQNGAALAIEHLNAAGGVDGREVIGNRISTSTIDPQKTADAFRQALDAEPTAILGPIAGAAAAPLSPQITRGEIPVIVVATGDQAIINGGSAGSDYMWAEQGYVPAQVEALGEYLTETKGYTEIGFMGTDNAYGRDAGAAMEEYLATKDLELFASRYYSPTATELSEQVLAMKGAEVVVDWGYPNTIALQLKQFQQNGLDIPTYGSSGTATLVANELVEADLLPFLHAVSPCNPGGDDRSELGEFVEAFEAEHGSVPSYTAASAYDAVMIAAEAVRTAGSVDPKAVAEAMATVEVAGACGDYRSDGANTLLHRQVIIDYAADGSSSVAQEFTTPMVPKGG